MSPVARATRRLLLLACVCGVGGVAHSAERSVRPARLPDGTGLYVLEQPQAPWTSLRIVVDAGSAQDPEGRAGLAHVVEHLIFHGSYTTTGISLAQELRASGVHVNAFTSPERTVFLLDAPSANFTQAASRFLSVVTNPALGLAPLVAERGVIATEAVYYSHLGLLSMADRYLFASLNQGQTVIGTPETRAAITPDDVITFYQTYYRPRNIRVIAVGNVTLEQVKLIVSDGSCLPPETDHVPQESPPVSTATLPLDERLNTPFSATIYGFHVPAVEETTCEDMATVLELRLHRRLMVKRSLVTWVTVGCTRMRGSVFILATAAAQTFETGLLPDIMRKTFAELKTVPVSAAEQRVLVARARSRPLQSNVLADELALRAFGPKDALASMRRILGTPAHLDAVRVQGAAQRGFDPQREILLHFSPFEG